MEKHGSKLPRDTKLTCGIPENAPEKLKRQLRETTMFGFRREKEAGSLPTALIQEMQRTGEPGSKKHYFYYMSSTETFIPAYSIKTKEMRPQGFDILNLSASGNREYDSSHLHRHTFYELFYFYGGEGRHEIDFREYRVEGSSIHFVSPGQIHKLVLKRGNGFVICFTEDLVQLRQRETIAEKFPLYDNSNSQVLALSKELAGELGFLIESVARELRLGHGDTELFRSYLSVILLRLRSEYITSATNRGLQLLKNKK